MNLIIKIGKKEKLDQKWKRQLSISNYKCRFFIFVMNQKEKKTEYTKNIEYTKYTLKIDIK